MTNILTAYCACVLCCGPNAKGITASGLRPVQGVTVAGPRHIALGTKVNINGHNYILQDRTARRFDGRWDIYFTNHAEALRFGKQYATNLTIIK